MSKGSQQRPAKEPITQEQWDAIFNKKEEAEQIEEHLSWEDVSHEHWG